MRRQEIATVLAPALRKRLQRLQGLSAPGDGKGAVEALVKVADAAAGAAEENPFAFLTSGNPMKRARELARGLRIESCAVLMESNGMFMKASAS